MRHSQRCCPAFQPPAFIECDLRETYAPEWALQGIGGAAVSHVSLSMHERGVGKTS